MHKLLIGLLFSIAMVSAAAAAGNTLVYVTPGGISGEMIITADGSGAGRSLDKVCEATAEFLRTRGFIASCK